jgi:hypothetical protein
MRRDHARLRCEVLELQGFIAPFLDVTAHLPNYICLVPTCVTVRFPRRQINLGQARRRIYPEPAVKSQNRPHWLTPSIPAVIGVSRDQPAECVRSGNRSSI